MKPIRSILLSAVAMFALPTALFAASYSFDTSTDNHRYFNDFDRYAEADWTLQTTEAGSGSATEALSNVDGGVLLITNDNADNDRDFYQLPSESFAWSTSNQLYCKIRFKTSNATQSDIIFGLQITDTTPLAVSDGIWFQKDDDDTNIDFHVAKSSTQEDATAIATLADDTWTTLEFNYNSAVDADKISYAVNGTVLGYLGSLSTYAPTHTLTVSFGLQNGSAAARTMTIDYVFCQESR